jgi:hypothetical protein
MAADFLGMRALSLLDICAPLFVVPLLSHQLKASNSLSLGMCASSSPSNSH